MINKEFVTFECYTINKVEDKMKMLLIINTLFFVILTKKLVFIQELFRHGARYPISSVLKDSSGANKETYGELTTQGKHMQYLLGRIIYHRYWKQLFEGTEFMNKYNPSLIYIKSTNINRTIQSAQCQLLGLLQDLEPYTLKTVQLNNSLPPYINSFRYQEPSQNQTDFNAFGQKNQYFHTIPIHMQRQLNSPLANGYIYQASSYNEGDFLSHYDGRICPNQYIWGNQNQFADEIIKIKNSNKAKQFLQSLSKSVGVDVKYNEIGKYVDDYYCQSSLGSPSLQIFTDPQTVKTADFMLLSSSIVNTFYTQAQIKTSNTEFIKQTISNMKAAMAKNGPRIILYSAHDTNILSFNSALNFVNLSCLIAYFYENVNNQDTCIVKYPSFGTNIILQLWEDNFAYSVKILYNGLYRKIPICNYQQQCTFKEFESWAESFYINNSLEICGIHEEYTKLYIAISILSVAIIILIIKLMHFSMRKNKDQQTQQQMEEKKASIKKQQKINNK